MESEGISRHEMEMKALTDSLSRIRHLRKKRSGLDAAPSPAAIAHPPPSTPSTAAATASSPFASSASTRPFFRHTRPAPPSSAQSLPPPTARSGSLQLRAEQSTPSHWDVRSWLPEGLAATSQPTPSASRDDATEQSASARGDENAASEGGEGAASEGGEGAASEDVLRANERLMMHVAASRWASQGAAAQANAEHRAPSPPRRAHDAGEADDERSDATARFHVASGAGLAESRGKAEISGYGGGKGEAEGDDEGEATSGAGNNDGEAESRAEGRKETLVGAGGWRSTRVTELESEDDSWDAPDPTSRGLFGGGSSAFFNPLADDVALNLRLSLDDDEDEDEDDEEEEEEEEEEERDEEESYIYFEGASVETGSRGGDSIGVSAAGKSGASYDRAADSGSEGWGTGGGGVGKERGRGGRKEAKKAGGARMAAARRELEEQRAVVERKWRESQMEMRRAARMATALKATIDSIDCVDSPARATVPASLPAPLIAPHHGSLAALPSPAPATAVTTGAPAALALAVAADGGGAGGRNLSDTGGDGMKGEIAGARNMGCSRRALVEARRLRERLEGLMRLMEAQGKAGAGGSSGAECAESEAESSSASSSHLSWAASSSVSRGASSSGGSGDGSGGDATWLLKRKILRDAGECTSFAMPARYFRLLLPDHHRALRLSCRPLTIQRLQMAHLERTMARIAADVATTKDVSARMEGHEAEHGDGGDGGERGGAETEACSGQRKRERGDGGGEGGSAGSDGTLAVLQALAARMEGEVERVREEQEAWRQRAAVAEAEARSLRRQVQQRDHAGDAMSASLRAELDMLRASKERTRRRQLAERGAWRRAAYQLRAAIGGEQLAQIREVGEDGGAGGMEGVWEGGRGSMLALDGDVQWRGEGERVGGSVGGGEGGEGGRGMEALTRALALVVATGATGGSDGEEEGGSGGGDGQLVAVRRIAGALVQGVGEERREERGVESAERAESGKCGGGTQSGGAMEAATGEGGGGWTAQVAEERAREGETQQRQGEEEQGRQQQQQAEAEGGGVGVGEKPEGTLTVTSERIQVLPPPPSALAAPPAPPPVSPTAAAAQSAAAAAAVVVPQLPARRVAAPAAHSRKSGGPAGMHVVDGAQGGKPRSGRRVGARNGEARSSNSAAGAILRRNGRAASRSDGSAAGLHAGGGEVRRRAERCEQDEGEGGETAGVRGEGRDVGAGEGGSEVVAGLVWEVAPVLDNEWVESGAKGPRGLAETKDEGEKRNGREAVAAGERKSGRSVEREEEVEVRGSEQGEGQGGRRQQEAHMAVRERERERAVEGGLALVSPLGAEEPFQADRASHGEGPVGAQWMRHSADSAAAALPRGTAAAAAAAACSKSHEWHAPTPPASQHTHSPSHTSPPDASSFSFPCLPASPSSTSPSSPSLSPHPLLIPRAHTHSMGQRPPPILPPPALPPPTLPPRHHTSHPPAQHLQTTPQPWWPQHEAQERHVGSSSEQQQAGSEQQRAGSEQQVSDAGSGCVPSSLHCPPHPEWSLHPHDRPAGSFWSLAGGTAAVQSGAREWSEVESSGSSSTVQGGGRDGAGGCGGEGGGGWNAGGVGGAGSGGGSWGGNHQQQQQQQQQQRRGWRKERVGGGRDGGEARGVGGAGGGVGEGRAAGRGGERRGQQAGVGVGHSETTHVPWLGAEEVVRGGEQR
ncbi:unnamed protein product [Closterium sp. Naga37s-1]|nr:unnamed protein product [Closterium sp. Naga37s-1]